MALALRFHSSFLLERLKGSQAFMPVLVVPFCLFWAFASLADETSSANTGAADPSLVLVAEVSAFLADTLIVRGNSPLDAATPSSGSLVTRLEINESSAARDVADLLASVAGFQVRRYGGIGASAVPSIRGSAAAQIRVFIDGMPLDDAQTGAVNLANLPLDRFQSIEIHRGLVPVGLGGVGGAGAVDLHTREGNRGVDLKLSSGSFGELGGRIAWSGKSVDGRLSAMALVHGRRADNNFEYVDNARTFIDTDDDTLAIRRNSWIEERGAWLTGSAERDLGEVQASVGFFRRDGGWPVILGRESLHASVRYEGLDSRVGFSFLDELIALDLSGERSSEFLYDPKHEVGILNNAITRSESINLDARLLFCPVIWSGSGEGFFNEMALTSGLERRSQRFDQWFDQEQDPDRSRTLTAAMANLDVSLFSWRLLLTPAWRWTHHRDNFPPSTPMGMPWIKELEGVSNERYAVSPSVGMVWTVKPERLFFEAHASRTSRAPTWIELFGHRGGIAGNRELLPEEITTYDLAMGALLFNGDVSFRSALFRADTEQTIIYIQNSLGTSKAINAGAARTSGLELECSARLPWGIGLAWNYTLQEARDRSGLAAYDGKALPYLPDRQAYFHVTRPIGPWRPQLEVTHVSRNYRDRYNTELNSPEARATINFALSKYWSAKEEGFGSKLTTELEVRNLTGNQTNDMEGFPLPGRSIHLTLTLGK